MIRITVIEPARMREASANVRKALADEVGRIAKNAKDFIRREMDKPGTGRQYRKTGGRIHQASAPGQFPAKDTGLLQSKIDMLLLGGRAEVGALTGPVYAKYLEHGTKKMEARPFIEPTRARYARLGPPRIYRALMRALGRL